MMSSFPRNQVIVITGAASGIGLATLHALRQVGAVIVGVDLAGIPGELTDATDLEWICGDVTAEETWEHVERAVRRRAPDGADGLVACAADVVVAPFLQTPIEEWRRLFEVNVLGVVRGLQSLLPPMIARGHGSVAVVCSVDSLIVEDKVSAYATSKAALLHVVRSAALEYARHGVRINAVCPGIVDTPLLRRHFDTLDDPATARRAAEKRTPTGQILRPEQVAAVVRFLVSNDASGLSGAAIVIDGGLTTTYDFDSKAREDRAP